MTALQIIKHRYTEDPEFFTKVHRGYWMLRTGRQSPSSGSEPLPHHVVEAWAVQSVKDYDKDRKDLA